MTRGDERLGGGKRVQDCEYASPFDFFQTVLGGSFSPFSARHVINVCSCAGI